MNKLQQLFLENKTEIHNQANFLGMSTLFFSGAVLAWKTHVFSFPVVSIASIITLLTISVLFLIQAIKSAEAHIVNNYAKRKTLIFGIIGFFYCCTVVQLCLAILTIITNAYKRSS